MDDFLISSIMCCIDLYVWEEPKSKILIRQVKSGAFHIIIPWLFHRNLLRQRCKFGGIAAVLCDDWVEQGISFSAALWSIPA